MKRINLRLFLLLMLMLTASATLYAQRHTDNLNRGLVAVVPRNGQGIFLSWRIQVDEYYDVKYNLYKNGSLLASKLDVSNYLDESGSVSDIYTVKAVVNDVEKEASPAAKMFATDPKPDNYRYGAGDYLPGGQPGHLEIAVQDVVDRDGNIIFCACGSHNTTQQYSLNDGCLADLDGDGEVEIILKRINETDATADKGNPTGSEIYKYGQKAFTIIEAYKLNGTRLWWIDCGPNMVSLNCTELNCVAYDWDEDGKAEVLMRGADNMILHTSDDQKILIGSEIDLRNALLRTTTDDGKADEQKPAQFAWTRVGKEYLLFLNGATGMPYTASGKSISTVYGNSKYNSKYIPEDFPLKRVEASVTEITEEWQASQSQAEGSNTDLANYLEQVKSEWGDSYGHRSNKFFFGAPFLDGRKASVFLARGIYTQIKMAALDVTFNQGAGSYSYTSKTWSNSTAGSPWYGQGNHNFCIADVDGDGCDEIIYGSMVIDNNMQGLSSTSLGHGDAAHVGDFNPYRKGMEVFACNEDNKGNNYRDATTSKILYRNTATSDDGRAMMGNFTDNYPGCTGRTVSSGVISSITATPMAAYPNAEDFITWSWLSGRIYWDGDLCEEYYDSPGSPGQCAIAKVDFHCNKCNTNRIMQVRDSRMINGSKNNPCAQGDIIGDWREELVLRTADNKKLMVFSTDEPTEWHIPSLWYDHEYRQAMVWQPCAYNQPPHTSFFLGEMEGITRAPLPLTKKGRTEIADNGIITNSDHNDKVLLLCNTNGSNAAFGVERNGDASATVYPAMIVVNASSKVSGNDNNDNISRSYNRILLGTKINNVDCTGKLGGSMRLVKQGDGLLILSNRTHSYTGDTEIWEGAFSFRGTFDQSNVWMNRHTTFYMGGEIKTSLTMEYGATLSPSKDVTQLPVTSANYYTAKVSGTLNMHEGSRIVIEYNNDTNRDQVEIGTLNIRKRTGENWEKYGPEYLAPVIEIVPTSPLTVGGRYKLGHINNVATGSISDIIAVCAQDKLPSGNLALSIQQDENMDVYFVVESADPVETEYEYSTISKEFNVSHSYTLDFEDYDANYGIVKVDSELDTRQQDSYSASQQNGNNKFYHIYQGDTNGREMTKAFAEYFTGITPELPSTSFTFEFDIALVSGENKDDPILVDVYCGASEKLLTIKCLRGATTASVLDGDGNSLGTIATQKYNNSNNPKTTTIDFKPTYFYHFKIEGKASTNNVTLTVTPIANAVATNTYANTYNGFAATLSNTFKNIEKMNFNAGRYHAHIGIDNIKVEAKSVGTVEQTITTTYTKVTLSEIATPKIAYGTYDRVYVTRGVLKEGYNTFCIPFNTTAEEIGGTGAVAYTLSGAKTGADNSVTLHFKKVAAMDANKPYLLKVPAQKSLPEYYENKTVSVPQSVRVVADNWQFVSNYSPKNSMNGKYLVSNNMLKYGGAKAYLNGMRAYFNPPASASNAPRFTLSFEDENGDNEATIICEIEEDDDNVEEAIYSISGIRQKSLQKGINIVRQSNGKVKKVMMK